jgi:hypothetical protein
VSSSKKEWVCSGMEKNIRKREKERIGTVKPCNVKEDWISNREEKREEC